MPRSPSRFIYSVAPQLLSIGQKQDPLTATDVHQEAPCALCGGPIHAGEQIASIRDLPGTFTLQNLLIEGSQFICRPCLGLLPAENKFLQVLSVAMFTEDGVFSFRSNAAVAYWVSHPPETPYLMYAATARGQHLAWNSIVSQPGEVGWLNLGTRNWMIRYPLIHRAWDFAIRCRAEGRSFVVNSAGGERASDFDRSLVIGSKEGSGICVRPHYALGPEAQALVSPLNPGELYLLARIDRLSKEGLQRPGSPLDKAATAEA